jgi:hypothetical protein
VGGGLIIAGLVIVIRSSKIDGIKINDEDNTIKITLNKKPPLPEKKSFKGSISLPNNEVAPESGISFKIIAGDIDI